MKFRSGIASFALILASAILVQAKSPQFIGTSAVDSIQLLPGPPTAGSPEARAEMDLLLLLQQKRTQEEVDRCASEEELTVDTFQSIMGPWFTAKNLPELEKMLKGLSKDSKTVSKAAKAEFHRPRPGQEDARIHVSIEGETSFAYPSGHATRGMLYALILAELAPEHREALLERGRQIGWDRVIAGVHHPSDVYAGRVLGQALAHSLLADPKFQSQLADIKRELSEAKEHATEPASEHAAVGK